ncbi:MAG: 5'/3'-nucleotidase SurE [Nitrospinota bacterium]|nr:5'/3'-nucleotidase SurE [Nitrospinota bacterium]
MRILLTNDDGINAPGIRALHNELKNIGEVVVVAPDKEQSAVGHAITIADPLRVREVFQNGDSLGFAVDGTPADCVKIAVKAIMKEKPDIVVSGINQGGNFATNIIYSGTVSAATEGTILGIPSIAFSMDSFLNRDFSKAVKHAVEITKQVVGKPMPEGTLLNVNIPAPEVEVKGIKVCRQSSFTFRVTFDKRHDPRGLDYYWQGGDMNLDDPDPETDIRALKDGYITITPIKYDLTNYDFLESVRSWGLSG